MEIGFRITIVSGTSDSLSSIPDSKAQESKFHKKKFSQSSENLEVFVVTKASDFAIFCLQSFLHKSLNNQERWIINKQHKINKPRQEELERNYEMFANPVRNVNVNPSLP